MRLAEFELVAKTSISVSFDVPQPLLTAYTRSVSPFTTVASACMMTSSMGSRLEISMDTDSTWAAASPWLRTKLRIEKALFTLRVSLLDAEMFSYELTVPASM